MFNSIDKLPQGFGSVLAQNIPALQYFNALPETERQVITERAKQISSKDEMSAFVNGILAEYNPLNRD